ncbi:MAG: GspMb/PilO family protein [Pseudomonadota bacterium]
MSEFETIDPQAPKRTLAAAGAALVGAGVTAALLLTMEVQERRADMAEMTGVIEMAARGATAPPVEGDDQLFYVDDTPQLAQAALQADLQALAEAHAVEIEVMRTEQVARIDGLVRLNLNLSGTIPEDGFGTFLAALDAARPLIVVEDLDFRRTRSARGATDRQVAFQFGLHGLSQ